MKLDSELFASQNMETLAGRTAKVATELEKRDDIASVGDPIRRNRVPPDECRRVRGCWQKPESSKT